MINAKGQIKATFYFDPANLAALRRERERLIRAGFERQESDLSDLINVALRMAFRKPRRAKKEVS
jgi:hypothetical protein